MVVMFFAGCWLTHEAIRSSNVARRLCDSRRVGAGWDFNILTIASNCDFRVFPMLASFTLWVSINATSEVRKLGTRVVGMSSRTKIEVLKPLSPSPYA
jgi:hypothetical protein